MLTQSEQREVPADISGTVFDDINNDHVHMLPEVNASGRRCGAGDG